MVHPIIATSNKDLCKKLICFIVVHILLIICLQRYIFSLNKKMGIPYSFTGIPYNIVS